MTTTQNPSRVPLCETTRTAIGTGQFLLEKTEDDKTPILRYNNLEVLICGRDAFSRIAEDIGQARHSIDIVCWGFDPAMELVRELPAKGPCQWPRGATWGELLKAAGERGVQVRLLMWYSAVGSAVVNNAPGYRSVAGNSLVDAVMRATGDAMFPDPVLPVLADVRERRAQANIAWYRAVASGAMKGVYLRTRGGEHRDVVAGLKKEAGAWSLGGLERWGMEYLATHHQKTIVIDYEGDAPCGYVMGLNSVTDYWDSAEHKFNDPRRGEGWEGANDQEHGLKPYQDYACRIEGDALAAVCKNFTQAWNKAEARDRGAGGNVNRDFDLKAPPENLRRHLKYPYQQAQILRTLPAAEGGEQSIQRLYRQASSFARHYIYIENQYFQHPEWVKELKAQRVAHWAGCQRGGLAMAELPRLHVMVVIPSPERAMMVPRTHDAVTELGHGASIPNQAGRLDKEIAAHDREMARYNAVQKVREKYPLTIPPPQLPTLSELAKSYQAAGGGKDDETVRRELQDQYGIRTLVASLWSFDTDWRTTQRKELQKLPERANHGQGEDSRRVKARRDKLFAQRYREIYIHSKLMIIDDGMFTLGSANLNVRSFAVDSEINIASDDPIMARNLRERVWSQHTQGKFAGGDATDPEVMAETFKNWTQEANDNLDNKNAGAALTSFLVAFHDKRTSSFRIG